MNLQTCIKSFTPTTECTSDSLLQSIPEPQISSGAQSPVDPSSKINASEINASEINASEINWFDLNTLTQLISQEIQAELDILPSANVEALAHRIASEVERICTKSGRIQASGSCRSWQLSLARHRLQKCLNYYKLGSRRGRNDLHSTLGAMVYRHISPSRQQLSFQGRYVQIEDFLQGFYTESLKAFRRENALGETFQPRTRLELAEYMAFSEQYAKRRITLPGGQSQQLVVLRAQRFGQRQPLEVTVDIEQALESPKGEEAEAHNRTAIAQQLREQTVADSVDLSEAVLRDRVVTELIAYLEGQGQEDCVNYLTLKLQDLSAPEIDDVLGLTPRQRDYLQQRFKYHVEKFTLSKNWKLVHQWLGADLDQNLGLSLPQWQVFLKQLSPEQRHLLHLKQAQAEDAAIQKELRCTPKQLQKRWEALLTLARSVRNEVEKAS
jgi:hypothetical protein